MKDKREAVRVGARLEVLYRKTEAPLIIGSRVKDLSEVGLRVPLKTHYDVGTLLEIEIRSEVLKKSIKAMAKIMRVIHTKEKNHPFEAGLKFISLSSEQQELINQYIKEHGQDLNG